MRVDTHEATTYCDATNEGRCTVHHSPRACIGPFLLERHSLELLEEVAGRFRSTFGILGEAGKHQCIQVWGDGQFGSC
jgi:hypothetical protein